MDVVRIYRGSNLVYEVPAATPLAAYLANLKVGDRVELFRASNVRLEPVISPQTLKGVNPIGTRGTVVGGPRTGANDSIWYDINFDNGFDGWCVSDNYVRYYAPAPTTSALNNLAVGDRIRLFRNSNIRSSAGIANNLIGVNQIGTLGSVVEGPVVTNGSWYWYRINFDNGFDGWCVSDNYVRAGDTTPSGIKVGDEIRLVFNSNIRSSAGIGLNVVGINPVGSIGTITGGPVQSGAYTWYSANFSNGFDGFVASTNFVLVGGGVVTPPVAGAPVNTALPTMTGSGRVNSTVTATTGTWSNSPTTFVYLWQSRAASASAAWNTIANATEATYRPSRMMDGRLLRVQVTATNASGSATVLSNPSRPVGSSWRESSSEGGGGGGNDEEDEEDDGNDDRERDVPPVNESFPVISGTAKVGVVLTTTPGVWSYNPTSFSYQWQSAPALSDTWTNLIGATTTSYTAVSSDEGRRLRVRVTASNRFGSASSESGPTAPVALDDTVFPPVNTVLPVISGTAQVGVTLTTTTGTWTNTPTSYAYQWQSAPAASNTWTNITNATLNTYIAASGDAGRRLRVRVTAINSAGSVSATSLATNTVAAAVNPPVNSAVPVISGTAQVGVTLTTTNGTWTNTPTSYTYQWQSAPATGNTWTNVVGATLSQFVPNDTDEGRRLRVQVTATNSAGSATATSNATAVILPEEEPEEPPVNVTPPSITGTVQVGSTVTVTNGVWTTDPTDFTYTFQWQSAPTVGGSWTNIASATQFNLTIGNTLLGRRLRAQVTATNTIGSTTVNSSETVPVVSVELPINSVLPTVTGIPRVGALLTGNSGTWTGNPTFAYQWQRATLTGTSWTNIASATALTYTTVTADRDQRVRLRVTATNASGAVIADSLPTTITASLAILTPTIVEVQAAMNHPFNRYKVDQTWTGGYNEGVAISSAFAHCPIPLLALEAFSGQTRTFTSGTGAFTGSKTGQTRVLEHMKYWLNNRGPAGRSGYQGQYETQFVATAAIMRATPSLWNLSTANGGLSDTEKTRLDLVMKGCAVGALWIISDQNPYGINGQPFSLPGPERSIRGYKAQRGSMPNYSMPPRLVPYIVDAYMRYHNGTTLQSWLTNFDRDDFASEIGAAGGLTDLHDSYRQTWTLEVMRAAHPGMTEHYGPGPTKAMLHGVLRDNFANGIFKAFGFTLNQGHDMFMNEFERFFNNTVKPGPSVHYGTNNPLPGRETGPGWTTAHGLKTSSPLRGINSTQLRGVLGSANPDGTTNKAAWQNLPNPGALGMMQELDAVDGGPREDEPAYANNPHNRSCTSYAYHGASALANLTAAGIVLNVINRNDSRFSATGGYADRINVGVTDFLYRTTHGHREYSKGACEHPNRDWNLAYIEGLNARFDTWKGLWRVIRAWADED